MQVAFECRVLLQAYWPFFAQTVIPMRRSFQREVAGSVSVLTAGTLHQGFQNG